MKALSIEMSFDFICPWCLIGKRNLEKALASLAASRPEVPVHVQWRGVQLLPDLPVEGVPFAEFYRRRLGSEAAVKARQAQVQEAAYHADVDIDLARIRRMPNTANAHRLLERAAERGSQTQLNALLEGLFAAYFQQGEDLGDRDLLLKLARRCGFDPEVLAPVLSDEGRPYVGRVAVPDNRAVPSFVLDGAISLAGAQPSWLMLAQLHRALEARGGAEARSA
ncbi:DsbA family oxidoreductase [Metapseudomonas furukawaii]|uniref:2-hydroxychromene-2-carboxylate isomerase/DsbA-like thioredoxin domain protein n=1 Tax=Metapseudomonas furukawaii TaxID=1149133 RepID=A0AAD1C229_METFU|nr:DsbA family oxidoreductase [Pseudomonas furukawaii]ELS27454.1 2-hydroxychromene-2-carboxylate isomerase [Pseudomonas furukawaii]BAU74109.1 2-hydroxychromene-2-carboxylate isomerase/DsbA-like thioredoxin domain protein [Pseudomonas furukawaii]